MNNIENKSDKEIYVQRFDTYTRFLHILIIVSFLSLAVTGMVIKFSGVGIFRALSDLMGGYEVTGFIHRVGAIITFGYFILHLIYLVKKSKLYSWKKLLSGDNSLVPNKNDFKEYYHTIKWFLGKGARPKYGKWTYWEKFDYFAVFWGVAIIGSSGLILWFPEFFTALGLPGWFINIATIIHSDEALLATGFIFTVHFFNTHMRADKFPIDTTMFIGRMSLHELKEDRPRQYEELVENNELDSLIVEAPSPQFTKIAKVFGFSALAIGMITILMIIYSIFFVYK